MIETGAARRSFDAAASHYDEAAVLQRHVGNELVARLEEFELRPGRVLDLGSGTGSVTGSIGRLYADSDIFALDLAPAMARCSRRSSEGLAVCADAHSLPFSSRSFDLVVSNMTIQWCDHERVFDEVKRLLRPGGCWLFSTLGPDTLSELRAAWLTVDETPRVHTFADMHHLGDALLQAGFRDPVMDVDRINLSYQSVSGLLRDLKTLGAVNALPARPRGLLGKHRFRGFEAAYEKMRGADGDLPSTWEVVYGRAIIAAESPGVRVVFNQEHRNGDSLE